MLLRSMSGLVPVTPVAIPAAIPAAVPAAIPAVVPAAIPAAVPIPPAGFDLAALATLTVNASLYHSVNKIPPLTELSRDEVKIWYRKIKNYLSMATTNGIVANHPITSFSSETYDDLECKLELDLVAIQALLPMEFVNLVVKKFSISDIIRIKRELQSLKLDLPTSHDDTEFAKWKNLWIFTRLFHSDNLPNAMLVQIMANVITPPIVGEVIRTTYSMNPAFDMKEVFEEIGRRRYAYFDALPSAPKKSSVVAIATPTPTTPRRTFNPNLPRSPIRSPSLHPPRSSSVLDGSPAFVASPPVSKSSCFHCDLAGHRLQECPSVDQCLICIKTGNMAPHSFRDCDIAMDHINSCYAALPPPRQPRKVSVINTIPTYIDSGASPSYVKSMSSLDSN